MTEHLPECWAKHDSDPPAWCICNELRACEQRIRNQDIATHHADLKEAKALLASRDEAWFAGVEAAREAVAAKAMHSPKCFALLPDFDERDCNCAVAYSLAAIDALREEQK